MIELRRETTVNRPLDEVVEYLADFAHAEQWDAGTTRCTRIDEGPVAVGARWRNVSRFLGRETELEYRLIRREPQRLTFTGENKTVTSVDDMTFERDGDRTRISYLARFTFHGAAALVGPLVRPFLHKLGNDTISQLTQVLRTG